jgi:hypothetical protein
MSVAKRADTHQGKKRGVEGTPVMEERSRLAAAWHGRRN